MVKCLGLIGHEPTDATIAIESDETGADTAGPVELTAAELFGRAILRLRIFRGWSQRDLERAAAVSESTISRLETGGRSNVGARRLCAVIEALGVDEIVMIPKGLVVPTTLELMLYGDRWERAGREADRRLARRRARDQSPS